MISDITMHNVVQQHGVHIMESMCYKKKSRYDRYCYSIDMTGVCVKTSEIDVSCVVGLPYDQLIPPPHECCLSCEPDHSLHSTGTAEVVIWFTRLIDLAAR